MYPAGSHARGLTTQLGDESSKAKKRGGDPHTEIEGDVAAKPRAADGVIRPRPKWQFSLAAHCMDVPTLRYFKRPMGTLLANRSSSAPGEMEMRFVRYFRRS